jgi:4-aminobutyrate aminotransferase-like enzyme
VCLFVNSGSEANDLALHLAKEYTKQNEVITLRYNTNEYILIYEILFV